ncbi:MAG TPA: YqgE/AlgH family protein [Thermoguttaceae bacterium]|nr:YqgE/AlgH family protein [Thermoguttaceae bacterium]
MPFLQGHLLVAAPEPIDPDLARSVILLIQHSPEQAFGVVVNRPSDTGVQQLWKEQIKGKCDVDGLVHIGGPAPGPIMAVHGCQDFAELEILPGVYYSIKKKDLQKVVRKPDWPVKIFDSHAGWGPGQLEEQIDAGAWRVVAATPEIVFGDDPGLWERLSG